MVNELKKKIMLGNNHFLMLWFYCFLMIMLNQNGQFANSELSLP